MMSVSRAYRMPSYNATLTINFTEEEFHEHCIEYEVEPCITQLRSWLVQKAMDCDPEKALSLARGISENFCS